MARYKYVMYVAYRAASAVVRMLSSAEILRYKT